MSQSEVSESESDLVSDIRNTYDINSTTGLDSLPGHGGYGSSMPLNKNTSSYKYLE